jgi:DNA (cytosine-5)-methyltransferase 1
LFFEFARILKGAQPKMFVAENVAGMVRGKNKGYFVEILKALKACGYNVVARVLDAQWLGVPQVRKRIIFIGTREDLGINPTHPSPLGYCYSLGEAISSLKGAVPEPETDISRYAIYGEYVKLPPGGQSEKYFQLWRASESRPCRTMTVQAGNPGAAGITHQHEARKFSIAEAKRIGGFPDDFILAGTYSQKFERIARSVPPVMMEKIANCVRESLEEIVCKA